VPVVEVFDPNCPACRDLAEVLAPIMTAEAGRARFYYVAYPLRQQSVAQVIALKAAQREGKFGPLVEEMFRRQDQSWGMPLPELVATLDAVGMDGAAFQATLQDTTALQPLLAQVQADADAVGTAFASRDGDIRTPRVAIGNRVVLPTSFTAECVGRLIGEAAAAR
jgi:protein-disulfide isomerase